MDVRILGPIEVWHDGRQHPLGGSTQRSLLTDLVLHANEVVPAERLIDDIWGEDSTDSAATALRVNILRLRRALPADAVATRSPGYLIRIGPDQLDLYRFERLVADARRDQDRGAPAEAVQRLDKALSLWRGPALADVAYEAFARAAIARLEEVRLDAIELRVEAVLAMGLHREAIGDLEGLVVENPLRERLRGHLMLALYRSGRQADALHVYTETRNTLAEELGIDPSPALRDLELAILNQAPDLAAPIGTAQAAPPADRLILVCSSGGGQSFDELLAIAEPLAARSSRAVILAQVVADGGDLDGAWTGLQRRRTELLARGVSARCATFTSQQRGAELARLAMELDVELLLAPAPPQVLADEPLDPDAVAVLTAAPCDVALLIPRQGRPGGPVLVPFGGVAHDWAAIELGAWLAKVHQLPLRLVGAAAVPELGRRDASRLLSHASLAIQQVLGVPAEPVLAEPGVEGVLAASADAGLLVVGFSSRWESEGLGEARGRIAREAHPATLFVRRGVRPGGLAPPATLTRFTWSARG